MSQCGTGTDGTVIHFTYDCLSRITISIAGYYLFFIILLRSICQPGRAIFLFSHSTTAHSRSPCTNMVQGLLLLDRACRSILTVPMEFGYPLWARHTTHFAIPPAS